MSFSSRPSVFTKSENCPSEVPPTAGRRGTRSPEPPPSTTLHEAIMASSSRVRDSLPKEHREHFETLRQEIIDFAQTHGIPRESLNKPDALREAASKLSIPDLKRLAALFERFEYLLVHKEPSRELFLLEAVEYANERYRLQEQYDAQVELLKRAGILHPKSEEPSGRAERLSDFFHSLVPFGKKQRPEVVADTETEEILCITGIDGKEYPIPTLEQIAQQLYGDREKFSAESDQGFRKILLVPFGMSLVALLTTFEQFLFSYQRFHPDFEMNTAYSPHDWSEDFWSKADRGINPRLVYYPRSFDQKKHGGKTKVRILKEQSAQASSFPGWHILLFEPSDIEEQDEDLPRGIAPIPRRKKGILPEIGFRDSELDKTSGVHLTPIRSASLDPFSPHFFKSGLTPEDWIIAFMTHLEETGEPLDNYLDNEESVASLVGAFCPSLVVAPFALWSRKYKQFRIGVANPSLPW